MTERIVVIGAGPVGIRFAEELLPLVSEGRATVTVLGAETANPYNRVLLAELAVGEASADELTLATAAGLPGIDLRLGARAVRIDRGAQLVELADGSDVGYDRLVLSACNPLYSAAQRIIVFAKLTQVQPLGAARANT